MAIWLVAAIAVSLLTAAQIVVHVREYGLLAWPPQRSPRHEGRPRLPAILRWEVCYYLVVCFWLAASWLASESLPPVWLTLAILVFAGTHFFGYYDLLTRREQLAAATDTVRRDSSVSEMVGMIAQQYKSYHSMVVFLVLHDALEVLMFGSILFYLFSTISTLVGVQ
jgi:hypothetical protein